jgi:hypothetical protein
VLKIAAVVLFLVWVLGLVTRLAGADPQSRSKCTAEGMLGGALTGFWKGLGGRESQNV